MSTIRTLATRFNLVLSGEVTNALPAWTRGVGFETDLGGAGYVIVRAIFASVRLEQLRAEIDAERISQGEILELQGYGEAGYIDKSDVQLREWAGLPEHDDEEV